MYRYVLQRSLIFAFNIHSASSKACWRDRQLLNIYFLNVYRNNGGDTHKQHSITQIKQTVLITH